MTGLGHSLQGRPDDKVGLVRYAAKKAEVIQRFSGFAISYRGLMALPET
jgi:hypothetical protein